MAMHSSTHEQVPILVEHSDQRINITYNNVIGADASSNPPSKSPLLHRLRGIFKAQAGLVPLAWVTLLIIFVFIFSFVYPYTTYTLHQDFITNLIHPHHEEYASKDKMTLKEVLQVAAYIENNQDIENNGNHDQNHDAYSTGKGTVIVTTVNAAWTANHKMGENENILDMFIDSMREGLGTRRLMRHVVLGCMDQHSYERCTSLSSTPNSNNTSKNKSYSDHGDDNFQCVRILTPGVDFSGEQLYLTSDYIKMMWRRIEFLSLVLRLGYNFIFMDADILWFRDPFPLLLSNREVDFQIACDSYNGNPYDLNNFPNAGFTYAKSNKRTIEFYEYWYEERKRNEKMADQEVLNAIKFEDKFKRIGLKVRFLDTQFFGGFCSIKTTDMTKAITMHATCCKGLEAKLKDLRMIFDDWKKWRQCNSSKPTTVYAHGNIRVQNCSDPGFKPPWACPRSWRKL